MTTRRTLQILMTLLTTWAVAGCGTEGPDTCSPVGFTSCSGNSVVTCTGTPGAESGVPAFADCGATSQFCIHSDFSGTCGAPVLGKVCFGRNTIGCGASERLLRCVWVSEQPYDGVTGDVGVWRVETDCGASSQVCRIPGSACSAP